MAASKILAFSAGPARPTDRNCLKFTLRLRAASALLLLTFGLANLSAAQDMAARPQENKAQSASKVAGHKVKDCADCPQMVMIPAGNFRMGSPAADIDRFDDEGPVHELRIGYSFALGKHELTRGEFARFASASNYKTEAERSPGGCAVWDGNKFAKDASKNWRSPGFAQTASSPVVCISWNDAQAYLAWLNKKVPGKGFRLPSEAEWEYAARAGSSSKWSFGDDESQLGAHAWFSANSGTNTHPVAQKRPNAFGLYDMHGNAWEWVQDNWHGNYQGAPADGSAWVKGGDQARRVLRGGAWFIDPRFLRSGYRNHLAPDFSNNLAGMRIARTL